MSPADARLLLLCAELERELREVERHRARAMSASPTDSEHAAAFVALELDHAYQAFESLLLRLERGLGLPVRVGATWHRALLEDAALEIPKLRPAVVPYAVAADWSTVMGFRHFLRHAYATELDLEKLVKARAALDRAVIATVPVVTRVIAALRDADPPE